MRVDWRSRLCLLWVIASVILSLPVNYMEGAQSDVVNSQDLLTYYEYDKTLPLNVEEEPVRDEPHYKVLRVYFDSVNDERVPGLLSLPKVQGEVPCVIFLHGYGGRKEDILEAAELIAKEGYAIVSIDAEYHGERREEGKELYSPNITDSIRGIVQTVIDLRRAIDYVELRPEIDKGRIGYAGGSMGGILGAIFIGVEPRVKAAALIVAGGNMSLMVRESQHNTMPAIREFLQREGLSYEELQSLLDPIDPINFIGTFSPRPVVFHLGKFDTIVPAEAGRQLYEKAGEPKEVYWYDAGHDVPLDLVLARVLDFMDRNLQGKAFTYRELRYWAVKYGPLIGMVVGAVALTAYLARKALRRALARFVAGSRIARIPLA